MNHTFTSSFPQIFTSDGSSSLSPADMIQDFAVVMIVAAIMILITYKFKQPTVLGYIAAGMIIGPYTHHFHYYKI